MRPAEVNMDDKIIEYMPIAKGIAIKLKMKVPGHQLNYDDFIQAGMLGLCEAARGHSGDLSTFKHYMKVRVRGAIWDQMRVFGNLKYRHRKVHKMEHPKFYDHAHWSNENLLPTNPYESANYRYANAEREYMFSRLLEKLPSRERDIAKSFFLEKITTTEVSKKHGITVGRVSQLLKSASMKLSKYFIPGIAYDVYFIPGEHIPRHMRKEK